MAPSLLHGLGHQLLFKSLLPVFSLAGEISTLCVLSGCISACWPSLPPEAGLLFLAQEGGEEGGQGTGWSLLWRLLVDCPASWPHAGKKRRKQSGPSEWPVPSRVWGPTAPSSLLYKQSKLQWIWKSSYSRASTPQPHQPIPGELILRAA